MRIFATAPRRWLFILVFSSPLIIVTYFSIYPLKWPDNTVTYYDTSEWKPQVKRAVAKWNSTGMEARIVPAPSKHEADIVIQSGTHQSMSCTSRFACVDMLGYVPFYPTKMRLPGRAIEDDAKLIHKVIAHEFGHVLGLQHNTRDCSLMLPKISSRGCGGTNIDATSTSVYASACTRVLPLDDCLLKRSSRFACGPLPVDVGQVIENYGGRLQGRYSPVCHLNKRQHPERIQRALERAQRQQAPLREALILLGGTLGSVLP